MNIQLTINSFECLISKLIQVSKQAHKKHQLESLVKMILLRNKKFSYNH